MATSTQAVRRTSTGKKGVLIVDDHPTVREGLAVVINQQADLHVCGEAGAAPEAMELIGTARPDVLIVDLTLQNGNGLELIKDIHARYPDLRMLVLSMHDEMLYAERALRAGAHGYVMKEATTRDVVNAVRHVLRGEVYVSEKLKAKIVGLHVGRETGEVRSPVQLLSDRELEVFDLIGSGLGTREIADQLHLSIKTISCYRQSIKAKLNLKSATELVRHAVHWASQQGNA